MIRILENASESAPQDEEEAADHHLDDCVCSEHQRELFLTRQSGIGLFDDMVDRPERCTTHDIPSILISFLVFPYIKISSITCRYPSISSTVIAPFSNCSSIEANRRRRSCFLRSNSSDFLCFSRSTSSGETGSLDLRKNICSGVRMRISVGDRCCWAGSRKLDKYR